MNRHAPTFDTAAFTAEELAAASVCGPTDLPDCVPGGCGGLVADAGCSVCSGDCAGANPPVYECPMRDSSAKTVDTSLGGQRVEALQITDAMVERARSVIIMGLGSRGYTDIARAALTAALSNGETP